MACLAKAVKKYCLLIDPKDETEEVYSYMPVSVRSADQTDLRNAVSVIPLHLPLPVSLEQPAKVLIPRIKK